MADKVKTITFRAKDEASETIGKIRSNIASMTKELNLTQVGSQRFQELSTSIVDAKGRYQELTAAIQPQQTAVSKLTQLYHEQRMEQREQSFMMRQMRDITGAVALGLTAFGEAGSDSTKKLTDGLNKGFVAFQGIDFLLMSMGAGPWGVVIAGAAGVAAAIASIGGPSDEANKKLAETKIQLSGILYDLKEISSQHRMNDLAKDVDDAAASVVHLQAVQTSWVKSYLALAVPGYKGIVQQVVGSPEEITEAEVRLGKAREALNKFIEGVNKSSGATANTGLAKMREDLKGMNDELEKLTPGTDAYIMDLIKVQEKQVAVDKAIADSATKAETYRLDLLSILPAYNHLAAGTVDLGLKFKDLPIPMKIADSEMTKLTTNWSKDLKHERDDLEKTMRQMASNVQRLFSDPVAQSLRDSLVTEFDGILGEQNSILQKFLGKTGEALIEWGAEQLAQTITNSIMAQTAQAASIAALDAEMATLGAIAGPAALGVNIASFGAAGMAAASSAMAAGAAQAEAMGMVSAAGKAFHEGTPGPIYFNEPPTRNIPIMVRGGETFEVKTERQQHTSSSVSHSIVININGAHIADETSFIKLLNVAMKRAGVTDISRVVVNKYSGLKFTQ